MTKQIKLSENARAQLGKSIHITWGVSRGRDTGGYTTCSLRDDNGKRVAYCNGGGYDMRGTVLGLWLQRTFPNELRALRPAQMPANSHWQAERARVCDADCKTKFHEELMNLICNKVSKAELEQHAMVKLPEDCYECPTCKGRTRNSRDGKTIQDGRYFYGLVFSDPNYNPLNARLEKCDDTFTTKADEGKTYGELQAEGKIVDLNVLRNWYHATSKHATLRHTEPHIDGACGESSVLKIARAIGICLRHVNDTKRLDVYVIEQAKPE